MKFLMYISGITGILFLAMRLLGTVMEFQENSIFLIFGLILLGLIFMPLFILDRYRHNRKINNIIKSYEGRERKMPGHPKPVQGPKGWSMNDSPFRERKSGLTWGGGNIRAAEATRGTRRSFLRK
jgi:hypothetical protein